MKKCRKNLQLNTEIAEIESELSKYTDDVDEIGKIIENVVEIAGNVGNLIKSSKVDQKRAFLKLILTNSTITDKKAWISLKKPFDLLKNSNGCLLWLCYLCNSRTELVEIGREIDIAKEKLNLADLH